MTIDIDNSLSMQITMVLKMYLPAGTKVYAFGSRVKGNAEKLSNLNLAVDYNGEKLESSVLAKLMGAFDDSTIPYKVEVVDLNAIAEDFKNKIKHDLILLG